MDNPTDQVKPGGDRLRLTNAHQSNHTSQCGEDGIIAAIFAHLGIDQGTALEFGAWDGAHFSNTNALVRRDWRVILIEGRAERFAKLRESMRSYPNVTTLDTWVTPSGESSLDAILAREGIAELDFLSVDINGDDYHMLAALKTQPKLICVEFNPTIPPPISFINTPGRFEGSSLVAFDELLRPSGYTLVHAAKWNAFFVRGDIAHRFVTTTTADAFNYRSARFVVSFFDGRSRIVDVDGKRVRAKNPRSNATAAVALRISSCKQIGVGLAAIVIVALAAVWLA